MRPVASRTLAGEEAPAAAAASAATAKVVAVRGRRQTLVHQLRRTSRRCPGAEASAEGGMEATYAQGCVRGRCIAVSLPRVAAGSPAH